MILRSTTALTFDDVLLVPKYSDIHSRGAVSTSTQITPEIQLNIPIISSNMDTVTEASMAIEMARAGGIGIIHRFLTIERQAAEVSRVKRAESFRVDDPVTAQPNIPLKQALQVMAERECSGLVVVDEQGRLAGILTHRDLDLAEDFSGMVSSLMTPRERMVTGSPQINADEARRLLHQHRIEKLPLVDNDGKLVGLITARDILKARQHPHASKDGRGRLRVGAALGVRHDDLDRAERLLNAGCDLLVVDIAHGHSDLAIDMVRKLAQRFPGVQIMAGNVVTPQGVADLAKAGAHSIKVGVGSGSICTTRIVAGSGYPQLSALMECAPAAKEHGVTIISDGGIRTSGDLTKAIAAGAHCAMLGSSLAGTNEAPGASVVRDGRRFKVVRGMASLTANVGRKEVDQGQVRDDEWEKVVPEGVEAVVPHRGPVKDILHLLVGGLRSGMTYSGAHTLAELQEFAEFSRITGAGITESRHHDVDKI
jgi:IMP dehydrogenase